ncbi:MAG: VOC family protein [Desulfobulbaceae bacterium]|nr:VOC family protein [Desulfobulbaceae bacterium]MDY0351941.1 VOC family protein [Desulfobulbaceae bacterium]
MRRIVLSGAPHRADWLLRPLGQGIPMLLLGLLLAACTPMELAPITPEPSGHRQPGQVIWHDLVTDDVESAKRFYGQLFGWTFEEHGRYTLILNDGSPIAGIVPDKKGAAGPERSCWVMCLSEDNVDGVARLVERIGGQVVKGPGEIARRGRYLVVRDPLGAPLVLMHSASGDPEPAVPPIGGWLWDELWTSDIEAAVIFYQSLGNYAAQQVNPDEDEIGYWVLMTDDRWQAGITAVPFEDMPPQWVPVIRVADPAAVTATAAELGGRVVITPDHPLGGGRVSLIEDPLGGLVMVQSWQPEESPDTEQ